MNLRGLALSLCVAASLSAMPITSNPCPRTAGTLVSVNGASADQWFCGSTGGAWVDAFGSDASSFPSSFRTNLISVGDMTLTTSLPFAFSTVPVVTGALSELYFVLSYDLQETGQGHHLQVQQFTLKVGNNVIWTSTDYIDMNATTPSTLTPQGNGADMAVFIPVWAFNNLGLTGSSQLTLSVYQFDADNGNDEWILTDFGVKTPIRYFNPNEPIYSPTPGGGNNAVPEPSTVALACGIGALALRRRIAGWFVPAAAINARPARGSR